MSISSRKFVFKHVLAQRPRKNTDLARVSNVAEEHFGIKFKSDADAMSDGRILVNLKVKFPEATRKITKNLKILIRFINQNKEIFDDDWLLAENYTREYYMGTTIPPNNIIKNKKDKAVIVECHVEIETKFPLIEEVYQKNWDFDFPVEGLTDVALVVGDQQFHVNKATIAAQSSYFKTMFFGPFSEANQFLVELKDVDPNTLQTVLEILYHNPCIHANNVENVLEMARMYDVKPAFPICERFLLQENYFSDEKNLELAKEFELKDLEAKSSAKVAEEQAIREKAEIRVVKFNN